jgi:predicted  nucleic acid-binding Zn-ribbon protein
MKSEALRNIRTMREVKTSADVARSKKLRTTNSLSKMKEEMEYLESLTDGRLEQVLEKEKRRFAAQEASIKKSRHRLLKAREKLAMTINKNRALTELRRQLQEGRWEGKNPVVPKVGMPALEQNPRQIELRY